MKVCNVGGCGRKHSAKGMCRKHYDSIQKKIYYANNSEALRGKTRAWAAQHKEHRAKRDKEYAENHREHKLAYYKDYYVKNKPKRAAQACISSRNRRARKLATRGEWVLTAAWEAGLFKAYDNKCAFCGFDCLQDRYGHPTLEHLIPLSRGGAHQPDNIVPACSSCNDSKQHKVLGEWDKFRYLIPPEITIALAILSKYGVING